MFFYRAKVLEAKSKEALVEQVTCPICGGTLSCDRWMPVRYSPAVLFRMLSMAGLLALLLCLLGCRLEFVNEFLDQFRFSTQKWIVITGVACICLPLAFFVTWWELKAEYLSEDDKSIVGLHCKTCGNGFIGLADYVWSDHAMEDRAEPVPVMPDEEKAKEKAG